MVAFVAVLVVVAYKHTHTTSDTHRFVILVFRDIYQRACKFIIMNNHCATAAAAASMISMHHLPQFLINTCDNNNTGMKKYRNIYISQLCFFFHAIHTIIIIVHYYYYFSSNFVLTHSKSIY